MFVYIGGSDLYLLVYRYYRNITVPYIHCAHFDTTVWLSGWFASVFMHWLNLTLYFSCYTHL